MPAEDFDPDPVAKMRRVQIVSSNRFPFLSKIPVVSGFDKIENWRTMTIVAALMYYCFILVDLFSEEFG